MDWKDFAEFCMDFAIRNGANYSEARLESVVSECFMLKNGRVESPIISETSGVGIRILSNNSLFFLSFDRPEKGLAKKEIKKVIRLSKEKSAGINFSEEKVRKASWKTHQKTKILNVSPEEKLSYLLDLEKLLKSQLTSRFFQLTTTITRKFFVNSDGTRIRAIVSNVHLYYSLIAKVGKRIEQRYSYLGGTGGWEIVKKWCMEERLKEEADALVKVLTKGRKLKECKLDVVLSPELVGIAVHECCGHPAEADRILGREGAQAGESYLTKDWLGRRIGSNVVTVVDDPRIEGSYGFYRYDDEGVKARRRYLIKDGIISEFLHNRETSYVFGVKSNGSARASAFDREPIVRMSTTFILPGDYSFDELIEDVKRGVYIKSFTEWNIDDKRWNQRYVGCEAYEIINGKLKGLIRRPKLEITTGSFLLSIDACGKDLEFVAGTCGKGDPMQGVPVWMGGPHIRLRNIKVESWC